MTEKLYYQDPFLREFQATVLSCEEEKGRFRVVLNRSAFYPEGGGQPADQGSLSDEKLGGAAVVHVREIEGEIVHYCDKPVTVGGTVIGAVDFSRRFDHMQQHSGEHIVSGMICERYGCDNVGFHLGEKVVTIDFNCPIPAEDLAEIEARANAYIWRDEAVEIRFLSGEALKSAHYRSKKEIPGEVRLVSFPGADCCACCGTHVLRSGQVGLVKLLSCQKFKEGVRIEMLAGGRAAAYCSAVLEQNTKISQLLSAKPLLTFAAVERSCQELQLVKGRLMALEEESFQRRAAEMAGKGDVVLFEGEMAADSVRRLCDAVLSRCGGRCVVFAGGGEAWKYAVGDHVADVRPLVRYLNSSLQGRGGGKEYFAQGSLVGSREGILEVLRSFDTAGAV